MKNKILLISILIIALSIGGCAEKTSETSRKVVEEKVPVVTSLVIGMDFEESYLGIGSFVASDIYIEKKKHVENVVILEVINDDQLFVKASITGKVLAYITEGDDVRVYLDGEELNQIKGRVESYNIIADELSGLFEVKVLVTEALDFNRNSEYVEVEFIIKERTNPAILRKSVLKENESSFIYVIKEGIAYKRTVIVGEVKQEYIEVLEGVQINDHIVIQGQSFLNDEDEVVEQLN